MQQGTQTISETLTKIKDTTANPAPLGLLAFGMTTVLLNIHNTGEFYALNSMILAMGIFYGGIAQIIAGIMEWKKNNTFGTVAFISYGSFWLTLVGLILLPKSFAGFDTDKSATATYFFVWGFFTFCMFIGTLKLNRALQVIFGTLVILFVLLGFRDALGNATIGKIAGWEGIVCGASSIYAGAAHILNEVYGKTLLPLGIVAKK